VYKQLTESAQRHAHQIHSRCDSAAFQHMVSEESGACFSGTYCRIWRPKAGSSATVGLLTRPAYDAYHPLLYMRDTTNRLLVVCVPERRIYRTSRMLTVSASCFRITLAHWLIWSNTHLCEDAPYNNEPTQHTSTRKHIFHKGLLEMPSHSMHVPKHMWSNTPVQMHWELQP
jgi:hypothetical protein